MRVKNWNKWPNSRYEWYHFKVFECFTLTIQLNGVIGLFKVSLCQKLFIALPFICLWHAGELYRMFGGFQRWCECQKNYSNLQLKVIDNHIRQIQLSFIHSFRFIKWFHFWKLSIIIYSHSQVDFNKSNELFFWRPGQ